MSVNTFTIAHADIIADFEEEIKRMTKTNIHVPQDVIPERDLVISYIQGEMIEESKEIWINSTMNKSIEFDLKFGEKKEIKDIRQFVPQEYHKYLSVFDEKAASRFPEPRPWDHKIELKEGFQPKSFKTYNLTLEEQTELDKFLKENLEKGYI